MESEVLSETDELGLGEDDGEADLVAEIESD